jgi:osmoprotectant transport system ATP-binding protein
MAGIYLNFSIDVGGQVRWGRPVLQSTTPPVFELRAVSRRYGSVVALDDVSLEVPPYQTMVLLGPSGGGKSTALKTLMGLVRPDAGEVRFAGQPLTAATVRSLLRKMGYVVQGGGLFPHLIARENAALLARLLRWDHRRIEERLAALTELTRLPSGALQRYPAELSGGQAQRVALMRALMLDPDVLLLDEPLGALDPDTRFDLQADLKSICEQLKKTVVLVTHDLPEAYYLGDRWVIFRDGKAVQQGRPDEVLAAPIDAFVSRFLSAQRAMPAVALRGAGA